MPIGPGGERKVVIANRNLGLSIAATAFLLGSPSAADEAGAPGVFALSSTTFKDGAMLPRKAAGSDTKNPNCVGENVSPQLSWANPPAGTKSYALILVDPEGRSGLQVFHWVAYGIPAEITSFAEGEAGSESAKYVGGKSTQGVGYYTGPCTPPGSPHHYTFTIIATDLDPKALPPGLTLPELREKLQGHAKAAAGLVGLFTKPQ
jgi:Raf kinase inhibitor-like YbhB/YbcL family protein